jgi:transposase
MLGKDQWQVRMVQVLNLEAMVPDNHMLRHIDRVLDLSFVRPRVAHLYCLDNGRPSTPPELIVRMLLLEYLYNLSDVRVCEDVCMHAGFRWFCHLNFDDPVPDRTTLVKTRKLWAEDGVFEDIMRHVVQQCIDAKLVTGKRLAVDGTQVTANAATNSLAPIVPVETVTEYLRRTRREDRAEHDQDPKDPQDPKNPKPPQRQAGDPDFHGERLSNQTHRSKTDLDARLYRKGKGQETKLRYLVHDLIDVQSGVILSTCATLADAAMERLAAIAMLDDVLPQLPPTSTKRWLLADKGYRATAFLGQVLDRGLLPGVNLDSAVEPAPRWKLKPRTLPEPGAGSAGRSRSATGCGNCRGRVLNDACCEPAFGWSTPLLNPRTVTDWTGPEAAVSLPCIHNRS